jgi:hypothetical protein
MKSRQPVPAARRSGIVVQEADGEILIYDLKSHRAHCLNPTAALVWKHCDGKRTVEQLAQELCSKTGESLSTDAVWLAVDQLEKSRLLQEPVNRRPDERRLSRRQLMLRIGISAAATLPFIKTIDAPAALQAASCAGVEERCGPGFRNCCPPFACGDGFCFDPR